MHDQLSESSESMHYVLPNSLVVAKVQAATCNLPHPDRSAELIIVTATLFAVAFFVTILRLISRMWVSSTIGIDDLTLSMALVRVKLINEQVFTQC
jgi:hypothetical protein